VLWATLLVVTAAQGATLQDQIAVPQESLTGMEQSMMHRLPLDLDAIRDHKPSWAGLSDAEKEANVAAAWWPKELSRRRRRLQGTAGVNESDILRYWKGQQTAAACDDKLAENFGVQSACTYSCPSLQQHFFPRKPSKSVRCFIYDQKVGRWPPQLLSMIQQRRDDYTYISPTPMSSQSAPLKFSVGKGKVCRNVTFTTSDLMGHQSTSTQIVCLVDGEHQHTHVVNNNHTVKITHDSGSVSSGVHSGSGGKTNFTIGTCSNILVRINTTQAGTKAATWVVNDGGHNGPWTFASPSTAGIFERALCLHDNDFTVEHRLSSGWHGSVSVVRFIDFRSTILVPSDQNWIIQGSSQKFLPVRLDARFQTGTPTDPSEASLVVRHVRFTGRSAPVDIEPAHLSWSFRGFATTVRSGGVLLYEGGGRNPADLPIVLFEQTVFDHNDAYSDTISRFQSTDDAVRGMSITYEGCLIFRNFATYLGAASAPTHNMWPFRILLSNVDHIENDAGWGLPNTWVSVFTRDPGIVESPAPARLVESESTFRQENVKYTAGSRVAYWGCVGAYLVEKAFTAPGLNRRMKVTYIYKNVEVTGLRAWMPLTFYANKPKDAVDFHQIMDNVRVNGVKSAPWPGRTETPEAHVVSKIVTGGKGSSFAVRRSQISGCSTAKASMWKVGGPWQGEFENTVFRNNKASSGAAILLDMTQQVTLRQCSFIGNIATKSAGAVIVRGAAGGTKMFVQNSVFLNNIVQASSRSVTKDFALVLQNSRYGRNNKDVEAYRKRYIIWQIDDGPINGVDWATCEVARNHSVEGVKRGLKPSWPDRASACGNTSVFDVNRLYLETVTLSMGHHVLRTGVIAMGSWYMSFNNWGEGAYIRIVGLVDPLRPKLVDDRITRYKGCANTADEKNPYPCPPGDAIWAPDFAFTVAVNHGGAIVADGDVDMRITDSVFSKNRAPKGHSLSAERAQLKITNTTIDATDQAMLLTVGAAVATCQENKCEKGYWCDVQNHSVFCDRCAKANEWGDGLSCRGCPPGQGPTVDRGGCEDCARGWFSTLGLCNRCPPGTASSKDRQTCLECPPRQTARVNDCTCEQGFFNVTTTEDGRKVGPSCHRTGFSTNGQNVLDSTAFDCETCASEHLAECIAECDGQELLVQPGWSALQHKDGAIAIFKCQFGSSGPDVVNGSGSCPGGWVGGQYSTILPCNVGYRGTLCGVCAEGWALRSSGECVNCDEDALYQNMALFIGLLLVFAVFVWLTQSSRRTGFMQLDAIRNAVKAVQELNLSQIVKIIVATLQICSNLSAVLHVKLPANFDNFLRWLASLVNVDLAQYLNCMTSGSYVSTLLCTVLLVPIVMLLVGAIYVYQRYQMDKEEHGEMSDIHVEHLRALFGKFDTDGSGIELDEVVSSDYPPTLSDSSFRPSPYSECLFPTANFARCWFVLCCSVLLFKGWIRSTATKKSLPCSKRPTTTAVVSSILTSSMPLCLRAIPMMTARLWICKNS
jgi:hypothetical protein